MFKIFDKFFKKQETVDTSNRTELLYPMLRVESECAEIDDVIISKPWIEGIEFVYKFDNDSYFSYLIQSNSQGFSSINEIHELAAYNLRKNIPYVIKKTIFGGYGLLCGKIFEASFVVLPEIWETYSEQLNDDLIVGISNREILMFVPQSNSDLVKKLNEAIDHLFNNCDYAISNKLLRYWRKEKKWSAYVL